MQGCWNPWHGCRKYSEGCAHCYVYRRDDSVGKDASIIAKTREYELLTKKKRNGEYIIPGGQTLFVCMTSDFFIEEADGWRPRVWEMFRERQDKPKTMRYSASHISRSAYLPQVYHMRAAAGACGPVQVSEPKHQTGDCRRRKRRRCPRLQL